MKALKASETFVDSGLGLDKFARLVAPAHTPAALVAETLFSASELGLKSVNVSRVVSDIQ